MPGKKKSQVFAWLVTKEKNYCKGVSATFPQSVAHLAIRFTKAPYSSDG
jgi:hypothetical protein